jgi:hypothetical protein
MKKRHENLPYRASSGMIEASLLLFGSVQNKQLKKQSKIIKNIYKKHHANTHE